MANLQIESDNKNFSFIIKKNPENGLITKKIRKGIGCGWYKNNQVYNLFFKEGDDENSFSLQSNYEYNNVQKYNSPLIYILLIDEFLRSNLKEESENEISKNSLTVGMINIRNKNSIGNFKKYLNNVIFEEEYITDNNFKLKISNNGSVSDLIKISSLFFVYCSIFEENDQFFADSFIEKYIKILNELDLPYFIRYLFNRNLVKSKKMFENMKTLLEESNRYEIKLQYGNTQVQRRNFIDNIIDCEHNVLDVGCGEGFYVKSLSKKIGNDLKYIGFDRDKDELEKFKSKIQRFNLKNVETITDIDKYSKNQLDNPNILFIEVMEHSEYEESIDFIKKLLKLNFNSLIITTPNKDFNKFYELEGFRHDDHKYELTENEFKELFNQLLKNSDFKYEFLQIGDKVDNISTSIGMKIFK